MSCCGSSIGVAAERQFSEKRATKDLAKYRTKGPGLTGRLLLAGIANAGPPHGRLLDIGSGVGALTFELLERGLTEAVGVDLSSAYVAAASEEAARRGRTDSVKFIHGDFVGIAGQFLPADVVTLDRVVCCYPEYERLLDESVRRAESHFALSYPRDVWYVRTWVGVENLARQLRRNPFRTFVHSASAMDHVIRRAGLELVSRSRTWTWCADVWTRPASAYVPSNPVHSSAKNDEGRVRSDWLRRTTDHLSIVETPVVFLERLPLACGAAATFSCARRLAPFRR